jgi:3-hydroxybutyryl-CoA dehydrogenase
VTDSTPSGLPFQRVSIIGAGTMGHGIAQVSAQAGYEVVLYDLTDEAVAAGAARVDQNLTKGIARGKVTEEQRHATLSRLRTTTSLQVAADGADLIIEAIPERLDLKRSLFTTLGETAPSTTIFGTNTSSISIAAISTGAPDPSRVVGLHFFNPVFIMKLLEIVHHDGTADSVKTAALAYGQTIGKECIQVRDLPGFATSRLGVCLGMEAIRMVQDGVASAEDIDKAMVLGYRHPIGPLKLTDLVGLDVRMHIGEYLSRELDSTAFRPPQLMREMVEAGTLGQKTGRGFYDWD